VFPKTEYWDQLPSLSSELKREDAAARFLRRAFPYGFSRGIPGSAYTERYPIPASAPITLWLLMSSGKNLKNTLENIVRMERREIATRYTAPSIWPMISTCCAFFCLLANIR
jgi:hypothetical protein